VTRRAVGRKGGEEEGRERGGRGHDCGESKLKHNGHINQKLELKI